jgi:CheY-like chemotaxis protein
LVRKILLSDDSVTAQNMGRKILTDAGYEVVTVNNGSAALKRVAEGKPDLIVLDLYMPGYSGLEVCQRLKDSEETAAIPILLTVGKLEPFKPEEARRVRADAHIVKPFEASELLTAITRLEERMAAMQAEVIRFGSEAGRKVDTSPDTGWKSRLGFATKKKKEETEEPAAGFRDFRKGKGKSNNGDSAAKSALKPEPIIPDIPRDITPEELDALSAVAAKLDGPAPASDKRVAVPQGSPAKKEDERKVATFAVEAPPAETAPVSFALPTENPALDASVAAQTVIREASAAEKSPEQQKEESPQEAQAQPGTAVPEPVPSAASSGAEVQAKHVVEIPVAHTEPSPASAPVSSTLSQTSEPVGAAKAESLVSQPGAQQLSVEATSRAENVTEVKAAEQVEAKTADALSASANLVPDESMAAPQSDPMNAAVSSEEAVASPEKAAESSPAETVPTVAASAPAAEPKISSPTDEELAQALRLLTPSTTQTEFGSTTPRWVAEPVALTAEEAAISLEAEMFGTFAARAAASIISAEPVRLSTIVAAVENRIAAGDAATSSGVEQVMQSSTAAAAFASGLSSQSTNANLAAIVAEAPSEAVEAGNSALREAENSEIPSNGDSAPLAREGAAANGQQDAGQEASPATFADVIAATADGAIAQASEAASVETSVVPVVAEAEAVAETGPTEANQQVTPTSEVENSMAKAKSERMNAQVSDTQQPGQEAPEKANAMAASATADGGSSAAPDASAIASIVDSVMADLRPKIVEEIAKKLAGK